MFLLQVSVYASTTVKPVGTKQSRVTAMVPKPTGLF